MIDSRYTIREDLKRGGTSEHRLIAFYGFVYENGYGDKEIRCIASKDYGRNQQVGTNSIFAEYVEQFSRPISEEAGRHLHPKMYEYLELSYGFSTIILIHYGHNGRERVFFPDFPTLYIGLPRTNTETGIHRAELIGSIDAIKHIKALALANSGNNRYEVDTDILPATLEDLNSAAICNGHGITTIEAVKAYLLASS